MSLKRQLGSGAQKSPVIDFRPLVSQFNVFDVRVHHCADRGSLVEDWRLGNSDPQTSKKGEAVAAQTKTLLCDVVAVFVQPDEIIFFYNICIVPIRQRPFDILAVTEVVVLRGAVVFAVDGHGDFDRAGILLYAFACDLAVIDVAGVLQPGFDFQGAARNGSIVTQHMAFYMRFFNGAVVFHPIGHPLQRHTSDGHTVAYLHVGRLPTIAIDGKLRRGVVVVAVYGQAKLIHLPLAVQRHGIIGGLDRVPIAQRQLDGQNLVTLVIHVVHREGIGWAGCIRNRIAFQQPLLLLHRHALRRGVGIAQHAVGVGDGGSLGRCIERSPKIGQHQTNLYPRQGQVFGAERALRQPRLKREARLLVILAFAVVGRSAQPVGDADPAHGQLRPRAVAVHGRQSLRQIQLVLIEAVHRLHRLRRTLQRHNTDRSRHCSDRSRFFRDFRCRGQLRRRLRRDFRRRFHRRGRLRRDFRRRFHCHSRLRRDFRR